MPISVQLSLELDDVPAPPPGIAERLPEQAVSVAVGRPAGLIAKAARRAAAAPAGSRAGDD